MKTIAADFIFFIKPVGKSVKKSLRLHRLIKRRIKNAYHQRVRHQRLAGVYTHQICRVVQRSQVIALGHGLNNLIRNHHRACKFLSAVNQTVTDYINLFVGPQHALRRIHQGSQQLFHCILMIAHRYRLFL